MSRFPTAAVLLPAGLIVACSSKLRVASAQESAFGPPGAIRLRESLRVMVAAGPFFAGLRSE